MGDPITRRMADLPAPDPALLDEARDGPKTPDAHRRLKDAIAALGAVEQRQPAMPAPLSRRITVAAFNAERLKDVAATRALLDDSGAHVALITEADCGMARSGNIHTLRALAAARGEGVVYGAEFVELDLGDRREMRAHAGEQNATGLHGNGIVTALRLADPCVIPLEEGGSWFAGRNGAQRRIGRRIAVAARLAEAAAPLWLVSVHLESKTDPADRAAQVEALLRTLDRIAPGAAAVIGGDFNTKALPPDERDGMLVHPERSEPLFSELRAAGFSWEPANVAAATQRTGPSGKGKPPFRKLDWLVTRGLDAENPRVVPALARSGRPISDHEMVVADVLTG